MPITLFIICTVFFLAFLQKWRLHLGFTFFGMVAFYVICLLWIPYYEICNYFLGTAWKYPIHDEELFYISLLFCSTVVLCNLLRRVCILEPIDRKLHFIHHLARSLKGRVYMGIASSLAAGCLLGLYATKGVALSIGNYGSRFESNAGTGQFAILSYVVVSVAVLRMFRKPGRLSMLLSLMIVIAYGMALFFTLGGARNYLIAAIAPVLLAGYSLKIIHGKQLIFLLALGVLGMTSLAFVRYGNQFGSSSIGLIALYTRDTVFPVQSLESLFYNSNLHFVGFEFFFDQFYSIIPRSMWPGKPIYLNTISYYFTEQVLAYRKGLIIASTGLGSLYLMGGWLFVSIGIPLIFGLFFFLDHSIYNGKTIFFVCFWPTLFFTFFCFRESFELGLFKILVHGFGTYFIYALSVGAYLIVPKMEILRRPTH